MVENGWAVFYGQLKIRKFAGFLITWKKEIYRRQLVNPTLEAGLESNFCVCVFLSKNKNTSSVPTVHVEFSFFFFFEHRALDSNDHFRYYLDCFKHFVDTIKGSYIFCLFLLTGLSEALHACSIFLHFSDHQGYRYNVVRASSLQLLFISGVQFNLFCCHTTERR